MRRLVFQLGTALLAMCAASASPRVQAPDADAPCAAAVAAQLRIWQVVGPSRPQPAARFDLLRHWATAQLGEWVVETRDGRGARLQRVTPASITTRAWSETCVEMSEERARPAASTPRFSDRDLATLVATERRGVIYMWSPHMPLSVEGYRPLVAAATERGLSVAALLDPAADRAFAAAERTRGGLPLTALRVADSVELLFRDLLLHAPAVQAFANGRLVGSPWPGFHGADEYGAFLDRVLATR